MPSMGNVDLCGNRCMRHELLVNRAQTRGGSLHPAIEIIAGGCPAELGLAVTRRRGD
jgi:hypothetical protein